MVKKIILQCLTLVSISGIASATVDTSACESLRSADKIECRTCITDGGTFSISSDPKCSVSSTNAGSGGEATSAPKPANPPASDSKDQFTEVAQCNGLRQSSGKPECIACISEGGTFDSVNKLCSTSGGHAEHTAPPATEVSETNGTSSGDLSQCNAFKQNSGKPECIECVTNGGTFDAEEKTCLASEEASSAPETPTTTAPTSSSTTEEEIVASEESVAPAVAKPEPKPTNPEKAPIPVIDENAGAVPGTKIGSISEKGGISSPSSSSGNKTTKSKSKKDEITIKAAVNILERNFGKVHKKADAKFQKYKKVWADHEHFGLIANFPGKLSKGENISINVANQFKSSKKILTAKEETRRQELMMGYVLINPKLGGYSFKKEIGTGQEIANADKVSCKSICGTSKTDNPTQKFGCMAYDWSPFVPEKCTNYRKDLAPEGPHIPSDEVIKNLFDVIEVKADVPEEVEDTEEGDDE